MHLSVTFKNLDSSDYLREYIQGKLDRMDKLLDHPGSANVVLKVEHQKRIVEINLTSDRLSINAKEENDDMQAAIDLVASGRIDADFMVTHRFGLERATEAFELVAEYRDGVVKAMIEM